MFRGLLICYGDVGNLWFTCHCESYKTGFLGAAFSFGPADIDPARCGKIVM